VTKPAPPPGPPWDLPLEEAPLAFVDLEMTGLDAGKDRVVEICIERVRGGAVEQRIHSLVRPEDVAATVAVDPDAATVQEIGNAHVHGIVAEALAGAPTFAELAEEVTSLMSGAVLVAHGALWDVAFLEAELARAGRPHKVGFWLDTLNLSRRTFALPRHSLESLREHFGLDSARAHRADADVAALREVWSRCIAGLEPKTPRDLWEVRVAERKARPEILAECKEAVEAGREIVVVYRPRAKPPESMRMILTEIVTTEEPPRVIGYQLPGRGRRVLRADRILRLESVGV
jgi:DNA polymerase III subunit epsilon